MVLYFLLETVSVVLAIILIFVIIKGANDFSKYKKMFFSAIGLAVILFILACLEMNMEMRIDAGLHIVLCLVDIFIGLISFCKMRK